MPNKLIQTAHAPVTVDGKEYKYEDLSETAITHLGNIRFVDNELARLQALAAVAQTARATYYQALKDELEKLSK